MIKIIDCIKDSKMKKFTLNATIFAAATLLLAGLQAPVSHAAKPTPGFNYKIPESITTPNERI